MLSDLRSVSLSHTSSLDSVSSSCSLIGSLDATQTCFHVMSIKQIEIEKMKKRGGLEEDEGMKTDLNRG